MQYWMIISTICTIIMIISLIVIAGKFAKRRRKQGRISRKTRNALIGSFVAVASIIAGVMLFTKEAKPRVSIHNMSIGLNKVQFDMKIDDRGTFVNDVRITIAKKDYSGDILASLSAEDDINCSGDTRGIYFSNLALETKYIIEININFSSGNAEHDGYKAKILDVTTKSLDDNTGIILSNITNSDGMIEFDYMTRGEIDNLGIYLTDISDEIFNSLTMADGLSSKGATGCFFSGIRNDTTYRLQFVADILLDDILCESIMIKTHIFTTGTYQYEPEAIVENVRTESNIVMFDCKIEDQFGFLTGLSIIITDIHDDILAELTPQDGIMPGWNYNCYFYGLQSERQYIIYVIADYETLDFIYTGKVLAEYQFTI